MDRKEFLISLRNDVYHWTEEKHSRILYSIKKYGQEDPTLLKIARALDIYKKERIIMNLTNDPQPDLAKRKLFDMLVINPSIAMINTLIE